MPPYQFPPFNVPHDGGVPVFFVIFGLVFAGIVFAIIVRAVSGGVEWADNNSQPIDNKPAKIVSKRVEVSGAQNSTSTRYFVTFELPGGVRQEFKLHGSQYGQLAEGDTGLLSHQGTRYLGFVREPAAAPESAPPPPVSFSANRVCAYCGSAIPDNSLKCAGCGWTWHPEPKSPVQS